MPSVDISPARAMRYVATYAPNTRSIVYEDVTLTARQTADLSSRLAAVLSDGGIREGDRVAYLGMNSSTLLVAMLACSHLKAVFIPVNFRLAAPEVEYILDDSGTVAVISEPGYVRMVDRGTGGPAYRVRLVIDDDPVDRLTDEPGPGWTRLTEALGASDETVDPLPCTDGDLAALLYTSGTTGRPKGVMLTHGNLWWNHVNVDSVVPTSPRDVTYAAAPLFHIGGLNALVWRTLIRGGTVVVRRAFHPDQALADMVDHRVTTLFAVPQMFAALSRVPGFDEADLGALAAAIVAGAPVAPAIIERFASHGVMLQQAWGLTETAPFATYLPYDRTMEKLGSAGVPMPFTEFKIVDYTTGEDVHEPLVAGELCVRGPNVTSGYWQNPEATAAAIDADGWFHSGDIGHVDEDGFVYIVDRLKDMIISGGENVYPAEVEHALVDMPGVLEVAVVGAPDPQWGETVVALLTCAPGTHPTIEEVREYVGHKLARYKLPTRVVVTEHMPRNGTGKLDKVAIREMVSEVSRPDGTTSSGGAGTETK